MNPINAETRAKSIQTCYLCQNPGKLIIQGMKDRISGVPGSWDYRYCNRCGLIWLTPWPKDLSQAYLDYYTHHLSSDKISTRKPIRGIKKIIAASAFGYQDTRKSKTHNIFGRLLSWAGPLKDISGRSVMWLSGSERGRLLDIGCGNGAFLSDMKEFGWDVYGVEPDPDAANQARQLVKTNRIFTGFLEETEFENDFFDAITMAHVIEHLPNPIKTIRECRRILRHGGQLVVTTPNSESLGRKWFKKNWRGWEPPRHLFLFTPENLQNCARKAGFTKFSARTYATTAFDVWLSSYKLRTASSRRETLSQKSPKPKIAVFQALCFWIAEYLLNLASPCGEELALFAFKE